MVTEVTDLYTNLHKPSKIQFQKSPVFTNVYFKMASKSSIAIAELRAQAVAKEIEKKQNLMRLKWFEENYEKVFLNPSLPKEKVPKKAAILYEELRKMRQERYATDRELKAKEKTHLLTIEEKKDCDFVLDVMYPVPEEIRSTLYQGVSHDEEGRYKYLKLRYKEAPYDKFRQKETSGFEYGWKIQETAHPPLKGHCRKTMWHRRINGAFKTDDPVRRPPNTSGLITYPFL